MEYREIDVSLKYDSNCHYNESISEQTIKIPLRKVIANFIFLDTITESTNLYYGNPINIKIFIKDLQTNNPVQWGNVIFYYIDKNDVTQTKQQINVTPIPIDINGNASIEYLPHNDGEIVIEYFGEPYYEALEQRQIIPPLQSKPTYIEFKDYSPYLVDPEETTTMNVIVKDQQTNTPLDYGLVTFLNYHTFDINNPNDGYEKVIGNPKFLNTNGEGSITYSPIQLNTNDLYRNIELIRASYNYNNDEYGVQWKYYKESNDYTAIAIRRKNQINILVPKTQSNNNESNISVDEEGLFVINEGSPIICQCQINVNDTNIINADVIFVVESKDNDKRIYSDVSLITQNNEQYFKTIISDLPIGTYEIYAQIKNPTINIDGEDYELPSNDFNTDGTPTTNKNDETISNKIIDGIYIKSNKSESFFIKVQPKTNNLSLSLSVTKPLTTNTIIAANKILLTIETDNLTNDDINVLKNKKCYFYIPDLNKTYTGTLKYTNNTLKASPSTNIELPNINDYVIYAYILGQTYTYASIIREYTTTYSNSVVLKSRSQLDINLRLQTINNTYPGDIKYIIDVDNIYNDIINLNVKIDNNIIATHNATRLSSHIMNDIPTQNVGTHTITVEVTNPGYNTTTTSKNFTIEKGNLNISLNPYSQHIFTGLQSDIIFDITNNQNQNIILDNTKLKAVFKKNTTKTSSGFIIDLTQQNNKSTAIVTGKIYDDGEWGVKLNYNGDNNYNATNNDFITIQASNKYTPKCININIDTTNKIINNQIVYIEQGSTNIENINGSDTILTSETYNNINQNILVLNKLLDNDGNIIKTITSITEKDGTYTLNCSDLSNIDWAKCSTIEYEIISKHSNVLSYFSVGSTSQAIAQFQRNISDYQGTITNIQNLFTQCASLLRRNLFIGYNDTTDTIKLYGDNDGA